MVKMSMSILAGKQGSSPYWKPAEMRVNQQENCQETFFFFFCANTSLRSASVICLGICCDCSEDKRAQRSNIHLLVIDCDALNKKTQSHQLVSLVQLLFSPHHVQTQELESRLTPDQLDEKQCMFPQSPIAASLIKPRISLTPPGRNNRCQTPSFHPPCG